MAACGLAVTCSDGAGAEPDPPGAPAGGLQPNGPVLDCPVLSIAGRGWLRRGCRRRLTAMDLPSGRLQVLLRRARAVGIAPIVISLATHDFVSADPAFRELRRDRRAQARLERLGDMFGAQADAVRSMGIATMGIAEALQNRIAATRRP
jgi:hypothetical protein